VLSWWRDLDDAVLGCLAEHGPMSPGAIAGRLGLPEPAVVSLLCLLASEGRVTIGLVDRAGAASAAAGDRRHDGAHTDRRVA
jgi:hypothetical protein